MGAGLGAEAASARSLCCRLQRCCVRGGCGCVLRSAVSCLARPRPRAPGCHRSGAGPTRCCVGRTWVSGAVARLQPAPGAGRGPVRGTQGAGRELVWGAGAALTHWSSRSCFSCCQPQAWEPVLDPCMLAAPAGIGSGKLGLAQWNQARLQGSSCTPLPFKQAISQ